MPGFLAVGFFEDEGRGGKVVLISAYAPHSGKPPQERASFFNDLTTLYSTTSANGAKVVLGDLNARLHQRYPGEDAIMGPHVFGNPAAVANPESNRAF